MHEELIWYTIPKFPVYEINEHLEVRHKEFKKIKKCHLCDGYWKMNISYLGKQYKPYLHQLVAWTFVPNPENKPEIHHIDCNPLNNHWDNLQWVTRSEHKQISRENGQIFHKLTAMDVVDIRNSYTPELEKTLADRYGVLRQTIYRIAIGKAREYVLFGKRHLPKETTKRIINIENGEIYDSAEILSLISGIKAKEIRRKLSGERYNNTPYRYFGEEHLSRVKPLKMKSFPLIPHTFGVIVSKKERLKSKNPYAQWKKICQYDSSGNEIMVYRSIREAARAVGANDHRSLQKLLNGRSGNKTYKGFKWSFQQSNKPCLS